MNWKATEETSHGERGKYQNRPAESPSYSLLVVGQPTGIQFGQRQLGDGRDFGALWVHCSWQRRKPTEGKSTALCDVGGMEQLRFTPNPSWLSPEHFPDGLHAFLPRWRPAKFFSVHYFSSLGFSLSFDSVPFPEALGVSLL